MKLVHEMLVWTHSKVKQAYVLQTPFKQPHAILNDNGNDKDQKRRLVLSSFMDMLRRDGWTVADLNHYQDHPNEKQVKGIISSTS